MAIVEVEEETDDGHGSPDDDETESSFQRVRNQDQGKHEKTVDEAKPADRPGVIEARKTGPD